VVWADAAVDIARHRCPIDEAPYRAVIITSAGGVVMNKPASIMVGLIGTLLFLASALRPRLVGEGVRFARWHHDWR
jgi:hypothetical protein